MFWGLVNDVKIGKNPKLLLQAGHITGLMRPLPVQSHRHLLKVGVLAGAFLLSVVLNNVALRFIPVSFVEVWI